MTDDEQRIAIAEACGWRGPKHPDTLAQMEGRHSQHRGRWALQPNGTIIPVHRIPRYLNDLNAMHEAEKLLSDSQTDKYLDSLAAICGYRWCDYSERNEHLFSCWHATARQRAEAFLRTIGKWEGEP